MHKPSPRGPESTYTMRATRSGRASAAACAIAPPPLWPTNTTGCPIWSTTETTASTWSRSVIPLRSTSRDSSPGRVNGCTVWPASASGAATLFQESPSSQKPGIRMMSMAESVRPTSDSRQIDELLHGGQVACRSRYAQHLRGLRRSRVGGSGAPRIAQKQFPSANRPFIVTCIDAASGCNGIRSRFRRQEYDVGELRFVTFEWVGGECFRQFAAATGHHLTKESEPVGHPSFERALELGNVGRGSADEIAGAKIGCHIAASERFGYRSPFGHRQLPGRPDVDRAHHEHSTFCHPSRMAAVVRTAPGIRKDSSHTTTKGTTCSTPCRTSLLPFRRCSSGWE